jgi:hypothetical protein
MDGGINEWKDKEKEESKKERNPRKKTTKKGRGEKKGKTQETVGDGLTDRLFK